MNNNQSHIGYIHIHQFQRSNAWFTSTEHMSNVMLVESARIREGSQKAFTDRFCLKIKISHHAPHYFNEAK